MSAIRRRGRAFAAAALGVALVAAPLAVTSGAAVADDAAPRVAKPHKHKKKTFNLQLLSFNDFHGHLEAGDGPVDGVPEDAEVGGVAYLASHIKRLRAKAPNRTLTVAAGDLIGGSTFLSGVFQDQPSVEAMNLLGLDVSSVGNHEFDEGTDELLRMVKGGCQDSGCFKDADGDDIPYEGADFKYLAANVVKKSNGRTLLPGVAVKEVKGVKVGFIGMTLEATPTLVNPAGVSSVEFRDEVKTAKKKARHLRKRGVETIIVLLHEGGYQTGNFNQCMGMSGPILDIAKRLPHSIDAVVSGHTHQPYVCKVPDPKGAQRLVTSAASFGQVLTQTHLRINKRTGDVIRSKSGAKNRLVTHDVVKDRPQRNLLAFWKSLSDMVAGEVVGTVAEDITGHANDTCRCIETPMVDTVADAILWGTEADEAGGAEIAFMNLSGTRDALLYDEISHGEQPGEITYSEAYDVAPFGNLLVTMDLTGQQIIDVLNQQYQPVEDRGSRPMLSLGVSDGFTYEWTWDGTAPTAGEQPGADADGHVVEGSAMLNGEPIEMDKTYRVATINFLADGGDLFTAFEEGTNLLGGAEDLANLVDFLDANPGLKAPADRVDGL